MEFSKLQPLESHYRGDSHAHVRFVSTFVLFTHMCHHLALFGEYTNHFCGSSMHKFWSCATKAPFFRKIWSHNPSIWVFGGCFYTYQGSLEYVNWNMPAVCKVRYHAGWGLQSMSMRWKNRQNVTSSIKTREWYKLKYQRTVKRCMKICLFCTYTTASFSACKGCEMLAGRLIGLMGTVQQMLGWSCLASCFKLCWYMSGEAQASLDQIKFPHRGCSQGIASGMHQNKTPLQSHWHGLLETTDLFPPSSLRVLLGLVCIVSQAQVFPVILTSHSFIAEMSTWQDRQSHSWKDPHKTDCSPSNCCEDGIDQWLVGDRCW